MNIHTALFIRHGKPLLKIMMLTLALLYTYSASSAGCSTFLLSEHGQVLAGYNMDLPYKAQGFLLTNKKGIAKSSISFDEFINGAQNYATVAWTSRYGSVTFNTIAKELPDGGLNEAGLYVQGITMPGAQFPVSSSKPPIFAAQWIQYVLDNFKAVDEVLADTGRFALNGWGVHFFVADRTGKSACIEFIHGKAVVHTGASMPVPAVCNMPYDEEMKELEQYSEMLNGINMLMANKEMSGFASAVSLLGRRSMAKKENLADYGFSVLRKMDKGSSQGFAMVDISGLKIYFRMPGETSKKEIDLNTLDFSCRTPILAMLMNSDPEVCLTQKLSVYSPDLSWLSLQKLWDDKEIQVNLRRFLASKGATLEAFIDRLFMFSEKY